MKSGRYRVSFYVDLNDCRDAEEAEITVGELLSNAIDEDCIPELVFDLVDELDIEYQVDEPELQELNFG